MSSIKSEGGIPAHQRHDELGTASAVRKGLFAILAIILAAITWMLALLMLSSGVGPLSGAEALTVLVFLSPIFFVILPWVAKFLCEGSSTVAICLFAAAPALGGLNVALGTFVLEKLEPSGGEATPGVLWLLIFIWLLALFPALRSAWRNRRRWAKTA